MISQQIFNGCEFSIILQFTELNLKLTLCQVVKLESPRRSEKDFTDKNTTIVKKQINCSDTDSSSMENE